MRRRVSHSVRPAAWFALPLVLAAGAAACAHDERRSAVAPASPEVRSSPPPLPPQYVVADPSSGPKNPVTAVALGRSGGFGILVDRRRSVVGQGDPRVALDAAPEALVGAAKLPERFGPGFVFWTAKTIYRADVFDGKLTPVVELPDAIEQVSFAPKSAFVRTHNGERWAVTLPKGERAPIEPLGIADIQALDDGRALAWSDQGTAFMSLDGGAHWSDVTAQVKSAPARTTLADGDLWLVETNGGASRLERDGRLSWYDKGPPETPPEVRPKDPRWHGSDTPLRTVFHYGAAVDDGTGIVLEGGDLVRVDLRSGEITSVLAGRLPPDASCEATPGPGDVLFVCATKTGGNLFVVSRTLANDPTIEQTFGGSGGFFASDDGGLAYAGSCGTAPPSPGSPPAVCVRTPGGHWEERDLGGIVVDGGAADANVVRWVPRADGHVVAVVVEPALGLFDPSSATFLPLADEAKEILRATPAFVTTFTRSGKRRRPSGASLVDGSWSFAGNELRGYQRHGESVAIGDDGKLTRSPFAFEVMASGPFAVGRSSEGRLYQSTDHGGSWIEVAPPPSGVEASDLLACSSAGCDLGAFYRVGWAERPASPEPPRVVAPSAPSIRRLRGLELGCRPSGAVASRVLPRTNDSPEDLGLGALRLVVAGEKSDFGLVRNTVARSIVSPVHDYPDGTSGEGSPSLRGLFSGYSLTNEGGRIVVAGPNRSPTALRRGFSYAPPFDPGGRLVRAAIPIADLIAAGRRAGMTLDEVLGEDPTESGSVVPVTPSDPLAPSDVVVHNAEGGMVAFFHGDRSRIGLRASTSGGGGGVVSGAVLPPGDEAAFLEVDGNGAGHVFKLGPSGVADLFDVAPAANDAAYYPANPDALAVGPKGELAIVRTPSGSDPPSAFDPPILVVPGAAPSALGPWSEVKLAEDPACRAEPGGWRTTVQAIGTWIRVATPELHVDEDAPMLARVRWTAKRPCLEGFEVKLPPANLRAAGTSEPIALATWLVAKGGVFARVGVGEGLEWRQPLECSVR